MISFYAEMILSVWCLGAINIAIWFPIQTDIRHPPPWLPICGIVNGRWCKISDICQIRGFSNWKKINISLFKEPELLSMEYMCKLVEYEYIQFERGSEFVGNWGRSHYLLGNLNNFNFISWPIRENFKISN